MGKRLFILLAAAATLLASCEPETEDPSGASVLLPQITLVNSSPSTAFLLGFDSSGNKIITTGDVEPYTSAQAKIWRNNFSSAEYVRIEVYRTGEPAIDTKVYEGGVTILPNRKYTFTVDKDYNVTRR